MLPEELFHELLRGFRIALPLDQEIQNFTFIVDGPPEPITIRLDNDYHFIKVPMITGLGLETAQVCSDGGPKLQKPATNDLLGNVQASLGQHLLNIAETQSEPGVKPY